MSAGRLARAVRRVVAAQYVDAADASGQLPLFALERIGINLSLANDHGKVRSRVGPRRSSPALRHRTPLLHAELSPRA